MSAPQPSRNEGDRQRVGNPALSLRPRALSSGGERFPDTEEVRGSNPLAPTRTVWTSQLIGLLERRSRAGRSNLPRAGEIARGATCGVPAVAQRIHPDANSAGSVVRLWPKSARPAERQ